MLPSASITSPFRGHQLPALARERKRLAFASRRRVPGDITVERSGAVRK